MKPTIKSASINRGCLKEATIAPITDKDLLKELAIIIKQGEQILQERKRLRKNLFNRIFMGEKWIRERAFLNIF